MSSFEVSLTSNDLTVERRVGIISRELGSGNVPLWGKVVFLSLPNPGSRCLFKDKFLLSYRVHFLSLPYENRVIARQTDGQRGLR